MPPKRIACFVSPHGFGHAARAAAVMEALSQSDKALQFEIFTTVPSWFFQDSMSAQFGYHKLTTDIGLVQKNAFQTDVENTLRALEDFYPPATSLIGKITEKIRRLHCDLIVCDIAPIGILAAKEAMKPSILIENFTWDWIYQPYAATDSRITRYIKYLQPIFNAADYHIQTAPVCRRNSADFVSAPVSRKIKSTGSEIRRRLKISADNKMVLVTTGGIPQGYGFLENLDSLTEITFVMPGAGPEIKMSNNLIILPHRSEFYHPDLVYAADAVVGKVGYSTLAEVYHAGIPFGYVTRSDFRESETMEQFIQEHMFGIPVSESEFNSGHWTAKLGNLLDLACVKPDIANGADQISRFIEEEFS
ncbi:MAG: hypothetical protein PVG74_19635 [Desulfobacterales bacterium]|jgi:uncharacterized protein (TIGR00661 family)